MAVRPRFDPKRPLVAARDFTFMGKNYDPGDAFGPFDPGVVSDRMRARQYEARRVNHGEGTAAEPASPIQMTGPKGGRYTITAPWLEEPEVLRGKAKAEKRLAELQEEGAPLGFIAGGSDVTVEGGDGGWYEVSAPWLDEPEKVQGREAAEARQLELHEAGPPQPAEEGGEQDPPSDDDDQTGEAGDDQESEDTVEKDPNERAEELGNQPNNAEQAADEQRGGTEGEGKVPAGSDSEGHAVDKKDEGDDGAASTVGP